MSRPTLTRRRLCYSLAGLGLLALVAFFVYLRTFELPAPTGSYTVGSTILELTDTSRHEDHVADPAARRDLVAQVWYPAATSTNPIAPYNRWRETKLSSLYTALLRTHSRINAPIYPAGKPFPVLLFGHRWNGQRTQNTDLVEDLASHGYVVVSIDHPYNSTRVQLPDGRVIAGNEALEGPDGPAASAPSQIAFWNRTLDLWAADDLFVLNHLAALNSDPQSLFHARLDTDNAAAFGHSFGGAVALRLCGLDPRIKAGANLDGWTFAGLAARTSAQPIMILYEQVAADRNRELLTLPQPGTTEDQLDRADNAAVEASLHVYGGYRLYVQGTQHLDFTDQPLLPPLRLHSYTGPIAPRLIQKIVRQSLLGFFNQSLRGQPTPLLNPTQDIFKEVTVESWPMSQPTTPH